MKRTAFLALPTLVIATTPALAHVGVGETSSFGAGFGHPLSGLDHTTVMLAVGLWAALKGGRALWVWPAAFVGVMLVGAALGMAQMSIAFVEPGILASVVALGLLVALAVNLPVWTGAAIISLFAIFHGHAHGTEIPETARGTEYMVGFAIATVLLHGVGIAAAVTLRARFRNVVRIAGAACAAIGIGLTAGML